MSIILHDFPYARYWANVHKTDGCWEWRGAIIPAGYGQISINGTVMYAHRIAWELVNGPIPSGYLVCHHCDVRHCVRADHLFLGTNAQNSADMVAKGRSIGPRGDKSAHAKLTADQVRHVRRLYAAGHRICAIVREYPYVTHGCISRIVYRRSWTWLDD